jgi:hypothetical protein
MKDILTPNFVACLYFLSFFIPFVVDAALARVQSILDTTRHPRLAQDDEQHKNYNDKYLLAEFLTNAANASILNVLEQLGLSNDSEKLAQVIKWVQDDKKTVTLRFEAIDGCSLVKEQEVKISSPHQYESETETVTTSTATGAPHEGGRVGGSLRNLLTGGRSTKTEKTTTRITRTVTEYHWKIEVSYKISIFAGDDSNKESSNSVELGSSRHVVATMVTAGGGGSGGVTSTFATGQGGPRRPTPPIPEKTIHHPLDVNLTWLFSTLLESDEDKANNMMDDDKDNNVATATAVLPRFAIDRNNVKSCKTPRRNKQVQDAVDMYGELSIWAMNVRHFFIHRLAKTIDASHQPMTNTKTSTSPNTGDSSGGTGGDDGGSSTTKPSGQNNALQLWELEETSRSIFVPILPLMENGSILSEDDANKLLQAQLRSMQQAVEKMHQMYPPRQSADCSEIISSLEATLVLLSHHVNHLCTTYQASVDYIEEMLRSQLIAAIGKEVQPRDFNAFMHFYYKKLFGARYIPRPFTFAIRQRNRYPDGILSVEDIGTTVTTTSTRGGGKFGKGNNNKVEPVASLVRHVPAAAALHDSPGASIFMPINAATSVECRGDRYIHGWMQHQFQSAPASCMPMDTNATPYQLAARARQFCSFMIIIGNMAGPDTFRPKEAIILQNKDEVLIPLITKVLPSAQQFRDAISSLSPKQQDFAKAFRSMQLETSVFGVCVVQIKPQLEKLLGLPSGALTKEIQLTQDLMSLFVDYQIPSDLLSFDNASSSASLPDGSNTEMTTTAKQLAAVKNHVKSVMDVLEAAKEKQLVEEERKADMRAEMKFPSDDDDDDEFDEEEECCDYDEEDGGDEGCVEELASALPFGLKRKQPMMKMALKIINSATKERRVGDTMAMTAISSAPAPDTAMCDTGGIDVTQAKSQATDLDTPQEEAGLEKIGPMKLEGGVEDYTLIPKMLDAKLEAFDTDNSLRPTIIEAGSSWTRKRQENLLTSAQTRILDPSNIQDETKKAFDLLDALSRSGTLPIDCAELHVMVGVTHCFENDVMGTVIQDNINPIHKVEKSLLMLASTIFREPASALLHDGDTQLQQRLTASFPQLFLEADQQE